MALSKCTNNANILNRFYTSPIQAFFASHLNLIHHSPHHVCVVVLFCNSAKAIVKFSRIASHSFNFSKQTMMVFTLNEPNEQSTFEKTTTPLLYIGSSYQSSSKAQPLLLVLRCTAFSLLSSCFCLFFQSYCSPCFFKNKTQSTQLKAKNTALAFLEITYNLLCKNNNCFPTYQI